MRGYGNPQATFAIESNLDQLAEEAGIDPMDIRLMNSNEPGEITPQRFRITSCGLKECMEEVGKRLDWKDRKKEGSLADRGVGMASLIHVGGGARVYKSDGCGTIIKADDFGTFNVFTGATDIGQGADTVIAQIVAETLGVTPEDVKIISNDTDICPWDVGVHASRTTYVAGKSAQMAAQKVKEQILEIAAGFVNKKKDKEGIMQETKLDDDPNNLSIKERMVFSRKDPEKRIPISKILRGAHFNKGGTVVMAEYFFDPNTENLDREFKGNQVYSCP
jgi:xanthine dehydrogenase molybdenum-binding subunit